MYWDIGHMSWMWAYWAFAFLCFVALLWWIGALSARQSPGGESPEQILKRRYARGEVEREEYLKRLEELRR